jgi:hypothetical protein
MKATSIPSEAPRLIILTYDDGTPADPKVIEWAVSVLNKAFSNQSQKRLVVGPILDNGTSKKSHNGKPVRHYLCRCSCDGKIIEVKSSSLISGRSKSCGCLQAEVARELLKTHGATSSERTQKQKAIYSTWQQMLTRCFNPKDPSFKYYGGLASGPIQVCAQWSLSFALFYQDVEATWQPGLSIDRYPDNTGHYNKLNYRWATPKQQADNKSLPCGHNFMKLTWETAD